MVSGREKKVVWFLMRVQRKAFLCPIALVAMGISGDVEGVVNICATIQNRYSMPSKTGDVVELFFFFSSHEMFSFSLSSICLLFLFYFMSASEMRFLCK